MVARVAIIGTILFIAIIDNFFEIIAIISVIGDKFGKIIEVIFVCTLRTYILYYAPMLCNLVTSSLYSNKMA